MERSLGSSPSREAHGLREVRYNVQTRTTSEDKSEATDTHTGLKLVESLINDLSLRINRVPAIIAKIFSKLDRDRRAHPHSALAAPAPALAPPHLERGRLPMRS
eukprot:1447397-Pleurochrysis_carterae.AAC.1